MDEAVRELIDAGESMVMAMASLLEAQARESRSARDHLLLEGAREVSRYYAAWELAHARWRTARRAVGDERAPRDIVGSLTRPNYWRPLSPTWASSTQPSHTQSGRSQFEKFTVSARKVLQLAQEEAQRLDHNYIGSEHLLLGLLAEREGMAAKLLIDLGMDLDKARDEVQALTGRGTRGTEADLGLTLRAKKAIKVAVDEACRLNYHYVDTEHLLLGIVREDEGIAASVLERLGVPLDTVRRLVVFRLADSDVEP
jgi:hypothetical protein